MTCGTDKTPMWRANTDGQKNLCNACGVRLHREQKKAKIARSGSGHGGGRQAAAAEPEVELLPRSRSKQLSAHVVARVCTLKACRRVHLCGVGMACPQSG